MAKLRKRRNAAVTILTKQEKRKIFKKGIYRDRYLILMSIPVLLYFLIFCYLPMTGLVMAFQNFKPGNGILSIYTGEWVGLKWFRRFFESTFAFRLVRNTFLLNLYSLIFGFPIPIIFAICITQIRNKVVQKTSQVITYLPYFISTVVVVGMMTNFLSPTSGVINQLIEKCGGNAINFMNEQNWFRPLYVISGSWQSFGFNSIIFVAAIMGISPELFEAMIVDGANQRQTVRHLVLPMIKPTIILLLIMSLGNMLNVGFEKVFLMYNESVYETADVISTYVYRQGITSQNYSYATAVGLFNSLVGFTLVFAANWISRKVNEVSIW